MMKKSFLDDNTPIKVVGIELNEFFSMCSLFNIHCFQQILMKIISKHSTTMFTSGIILLSQIYMLQKFDF